MALASTEIVSALDIHRLRNKIRELASRAELSFQELQDYFPQTGKTGKTESNPGRITN
jgi:hypothetical protein